MTTMNNLFDSTMYFGGNAPFVEELYENYLNNPTAVPEEWREYFDRLAQMPGFVARDVAHAPVISAFAELAKDGGFRPAPVAGGDNKKQSAVAQAVDHRIFFGDADGKVAQRQYIAEHADFNSLGFLAQRGRDQIGRGHGGISAVVMLVENHAIKTQLFAVSHL